MARCRSASPHSRSSSSPVHLPEPALFATMSKRISPTPVRPTKLIKMDNVWSIIEDDTEKKEMFKPVEGGPKLRILKSCVLNHKPRVDLSVSLDGFYPEVRLTGPDGIFTMTGDEFLEMSDTHKEPGLADRVRLEPVAEEDGGGFCLTRYDSTQSGMNSLQHRDMFGLNKYAVKRLKEKLSVMRDHVNALKVNEVVIRLMFECVVDVYEREYVLLQKSQPIHDHFTTLSRIVEVYVPPTVIVRAFLEKCHEKGLVSTFNHYGLLSAVLPQKPTLFALCL